MKNLFEVIAVIKGKSYVVGIIPAKDEIEAVEKGTKFYGNSVVGARFSGTTNGTI